MQPKLISLFNHKGGVSKTTTAFNLSWALSLQGKSVLMVDCDPQCNLTGMVLDFQDKKDYEDFYKNNTNLYDAILPAFSDQSKPLESVAVTQVNPENSNLFILPGHLRLAETESQIAVAIKTSTALPVMKSLPGAICHLLRETAKNKNIDYVIIDQSPSVGALNQVVLMGSDYFIVPTFPDYFCGQAIDSLASVIPGWATEVQPFRNADINYPMSPNNPKFIGYISQRYRPRNNAPSRSFQGWIDKIATKISDNLIPALRTIDMVNEQSNYSLAQIRDFNSLIAKSQEYNCPVFNLTDGQIEQVGNVLEKSRANVEEFRTTFTALANQVIQVTGG